MALPSDSGDLRRRFYDLTRLVSDWVWETDANFRLTYVSFRVFEALGLHSLELVGRRLIDIGRFLTEDGDPLDVNWRSPFRDLSFETVDRSGIPRFFLISGLPVYSVKTGAFEGVRGTARDVTERLRAEQALRESERLLRTVISNIPVVLFAIDREGRFTLREGKSLEVLEQKPGDFVGQSIFEVRRDTPDVLRNVRRALAGEFVHGTATIKDHVFETVYSPFEDEHGEIAGVIGVAANVTGRMQAQDELRESEERFRNLIEGSVLGIVISEHGRPLFANHAYARMFGYDSPLEILRLGSLDALYDPDERERIRSYASARMQGLDAPVRYQFQGRKKDGTAIWLDTQVRVVGWKGAPATQSTVVDITEQKRMLENLRKLSLVVEQSLASVVITDTQGRIEYVNPKFVEVTGYAPEEVIGKNPRMLKSGHTPTRQYQALWSAITAGREWRGEFHNRRKNGELFWEYASVSPIKTQDGTISHFLAVKEDITLRKEYEQRLVQQANFDDVTGLPNRVLALDRLSQALVRSRRRDTRVALLFIDLDHFKRINDTLGHPIGDQVLKETGARIRTCVREEDTVARLGGDEFAVIIPGFTSELDVEPVAAKILETFTQPLDIGGRNVFLTASIGITFWPNDGNDPNALMRNAESALYQAKDTGRNTLRFFTPELNEEALQRARIEMQMRMAMERGEFSVHYQPIIELRSGRLARAEALLRWQNPELGSVPPDSFIPLAEDIGLIEPIGEWVLETACREAAEWQRDKKDPVSVSVNVSSRQFRGSSLVDAVLRTLKNTGLSPSSLELEITENLLMADLPEITATLKKLENIGVRLSLDDFGTGYSSLSYLRRFPVDVLKIDKSFVRELAVDSGDAPLVEAIITMARSLSLEVVAEGVETDQQMEFLRSLGCDLAQGYYFSRPIPPASFVELMSGWEPDSYIGDPDAPVR